MTTNHDQNLAVKYITADGMKPADAAKKWVEGNPDKVNAGLGADRFGRSARERRAAAMTGPQVVIVGAGVVGAALADELALRGWTTSP